MQRSSNFRLGRFLRLLANCTISPVSDFEILDFLNVFFDEIWGFLENMAQNSKIAVQSI